jgi:hypothetical protein
MAESKVHLQHPRPSATEETCERTAEVVLGGVAAADPEAPKRNPFARMVKK